MPLRPLGGPEKLPGGAAELDHRAERHGAQDEEMGERAPEESVDAPRREPDRGAALRDWLNQGNAAGPSQAAPPPSSPPNSSRSPSEDHVASISGPSFLGLSGEADIGLLDEEEPRSHVRRNVLLAILAVFLVLAVMQWRSMRDTGLAYLQNGSMRVAPQSTATRNSPAVAADNAGLVPGNVAQAPSPAQAGSPQPVETSPNAGRAVASSVPEPSDQTAATNPPAMANRTEPVENTKPVELAETSTAGARPANSQGTHEATVPGAAEMARASRAADSAARAAWLWRAVSKGNPVAPIELAHMYAEGRGVAQSCDQAQLLLQSAAARGNGEAQQDLRQLRARGNCAAR